MTKIKIPTAAIILIGNEILSGRTKDLNGNYLAKKLFDFGISVREIRIIPDDRIEIIDSINAFRKKFSYVFSSGGIGPTHDDITAECVAEAFGVPLPINQKAKRMLASNYPGGESDLNKARLRMARIPVGSSLIENSISKAPGFKIENVFVLAGVPKVFQVMVDSVLNNLEPADPIISKTMTIYKPEGEIAGNLTQIASKFPEVSIGSYPFETDGIFGTNIVVTSTNQEIINKIITLISKI